MAEAAAPAAAPPALVCAYCAASFASRNGLFKHLRDLSGACGASVGEQGGIATSKADGARRLRIPKGWRPPGEEVVARTRTQRNPSAVELWFGDIPRHLATKRNVAQFLYTCLPRDIPLPYVGRIVPKGYKGRNCEWLAYAFVEVRDEAEAVRVMQAADGAEVGGSDDGTPSFRLRVQRRLQQNATRSSQDTQELAKVPLPVALTSHRVTRRDPPLAQQLAWLTRTDAEERLASLAPHVPGGSLSDEDLVDELARAYAKSPRPEVSHRGRAVPEGLRSELLRILKEMRWPPRPERRRVHAKGYAILKRHVRPDDPYAELKAICEQIIAWATRANQSSFPYDTLAVTCDFIGSPHVDYDAGTQYALSLGDFDAGGELVIDAGTALHVVSTKDAIAQVDGRYTHWVRPWTGGVRYSVIWVILKADSEHAQPRGDPVIL